MDDDDAVGVERQLAIVQTWKPLSATLYRIATETGQRDYLSHPFGPDTPTWRISSFKDLDDEQFTQCLQQREEHMSFISVESIDFSKPVEIAPLGGTLVLYNSIDTP